MKGERHGMGIGLFAAFLTERENVGTFLGEMPFVFRWFPKSHYLTGI